MFPFTDDTDTDTGHCLTMSVTTIASYRASWISRQRANPYFWARCESFRYLAPPPPGLPLVKDMMRPAHSMESNTRTGRFTRGYPALSADFSSYLKSWSALCATMHPVTRSMAAYTLSSTPNASCTPSFIRFKLNLSTPSPMELPVQTLLGYPMLMPNGASRQQFVSIQSLAALANRWRQVVTAADPTVRTDKKARDVAVLAAMADSSSLATISLRRPTPAATFASPARLSSLPPTPPRFTGRLSCPCGDASGNGLVKSGGRNERASDGLAGWGGPAPGCLRALMQKRPTVATRAPVSKMQRPRP